MSIGNRWFNFRTGQWELHFAAPKSLQDYIPQDYETQGIFAARKLEGQSALEAVVGILQQLSGKGAVE